MLREKIQRNINLIFLWATFAFVYAWQSTMIFIFEDSPLSRLPFSNDNLNTARIFFFAAEGAALFLCLFLQNDKPHRIFDFLTSALMLCGAVNIIFARGEYYLYFSFAFLGLATGAVMFRTLYKLFFFVPPDKWPVFVASSHIVIELLIYAFSMPLGFAFKISLSFAALALGLTANNLFKGNVLEKRVSLPDTKIKFPPVLYYFFLLAGISLCITVMKNTAFPVLTGENDFYYKIITEAVAIAAVFLLSKRFKRTSYYITAVALITVSLVLFQGFGIRRGIAVRSFADAAYIFYDVFLYSFCGAIFYMFGNKFYRLRGFICMLIPAMLLPAVLSEFAIKTEAALPYLYLLIAAMFIVLYAFRGKMEFDTGWFKDKVPETITPEINGNGADIPPSDTQSAEASLDSLMSQIRQGRLTEREQGILLLLIENRDTDVIAYMSGISESTARTHINNICNKFGVHSKKELITLAGINKTGLTKREEEILSLVLFNEDNETIAERLFISPLTVKTHIANICYKMSVKSKTELIDKHKNNLSTNNTPAN